MTGRFFNARMATMVFALLITFIVGTTALPREVDAAYVPETTIEVDDLESDVVEPEGDTTKPVDDTLDPVDDANTSDSDTDTDDSPPQELPLSEDEGTEAFWVNVRRFVTVIAFVAVLFALWAKIEKNRATERSR